MQFYLCFKGILVFKVEKIKKCVMLAYFFKNGHTGNTQQCAAFCVILVNWQICAGQILGPEQTFPEIGLSCCRKFKNSHVR